jgi:hypothetical protein
MALRRPFLNELHHLCLYFETGRLFADQEDFKKIVPKALSGESVPPLKSQYQRRAQACSLISLVPLHFLFRTVALTGSFTVLAVFQFGG